MTKTKTVTITVTPDEGKPYHIDCEVPVGQHDMVTVAGLSIPRRARATVTSK